MLLESAPPAETQTANDERGSTMQDSSPDFAAHWSTATPARSPLLMLGGSVIAAVMLIGTGLSVLGTEASAPGAGGAPTAQRLAASPRAAVTTLAVVGDLKTLQVASAEPR